MTTPNQLPTTKWKLKEAGDKNIETLLSKEFGIHPIISQILKLAANDPKFPYKEPQNS